MSAELDRLLHDAEHADSGARMAGMMRDEGARREFIAKRTALLAQAKALDPTFTSELWGEIEPALCRLAEAST